MNTRTILRSILGGALLGAAFYMAPFFLVRFVLFFLLVGLAIRLIRGPRRWGRGRFSPGGQGGWGGGGPLALADKIRTMSEEDYLAYRTRAAQRFAYCRPGQPATATSTATA